MVADHHLFIPVSITAGRYDDDVLQTTFLPCLNRLPQVLFQKDNARPRITRPIKEFLQEAGVNVLPLSDQSSDFNPIKMCGI